MPAYIASIVAACIATRFTAANGEGVPQVTSLPTSSSFLANPPVAYLVAAPIAGPPTPSELRAQRVRARAARQAQGPPPRGVPYSPPNDQSVMEGFAAPSSNAEGTQSEVNNRLGPTARSNRARQRFVGGDFKGLDLSGMTPTQIRDLKSFINLAQGSSTGTVSPFLAPIVPITAEDLARIQEHLLNDNVKSDNAKAENVKATSDAEADEADAEITAVAAVAESVAHVPTGPASGTTVIDRPVFVDRQGGPLVIIQQHAHHQEDEIETLHTDAAEDSETGSSMSSETHFANEDGSLPHLAELEPIEYVPFALIDRDGRVAILERNNRPSPPSNTPATLSGSETDFQPSATPADAPREAPKQLPAAIRKQLEEGRLPPPSFMFGPHANGGWIPPLGLPPSPRSQERALEESNREFYLAPAAGYNRPPVNGQKYIPSGSSGQQKSTAATKSGESTPILIRMPNSAEGGDNNEWNPTALLLGKGPATVRRAIELEPTTNEATSPEQK